MGSAPLTDMPVRSRKDRGRIARAFAGAPRAACRRHGAGVYPLADSPHTQPSGYPVQLSILLLTIDRSAADSLTAALSKPGHGLTTVADPVDLFAAASGYSLVIVDRVKNPYTV